MRSFGEYLTREGWRRDWEETKMRYPELSGLHRTIITISDASMRKEAQEAFYHGHRYCFKQGISPLEQLPWNASILVHDESTAGAISDLVRRGFTIVSYCPLTPYAGGRGFTE